MDSTTTLVHLLQQATSSCACFPISQDFINALSFGYPTFHLKAMIGLLNDMWIEKVENF
jgi:hypothetical protein